MLAAPSSSFLRLSRLHHRLSAGALLLIILLSALALLSRQHAKEPLSVVVPRSASADYGLPAFQAHHKPHKHKPDRFHTVSARVPAPRLPSLALSPSEELAAIVSFLASLPANGIPHSVDPNVPIDPQLVLDFDLTTDRARAEVEHLVSDTWATNPVVIFSKVREPTSREAKTIMDTYRLRPAPTIFDVDERGDVDVLTPILFRLTGATTFPIVLIGGNRVDLDTLRADHTDGKLRSNLTAAGAVVGGRKKKKGKK
ncbi:hypothetical protein BOTBODRAFT_168826 [Botryobasidium botryosum FD-172 SS1]|uniref:Uncharacterized protein n=1 Tax=Botryobasidium botryosum (strain FD-172 SS1) TaxID=930990 RepID=A0A067N142_BOTB1|nr:hypothetical protein BOTBODRAFT_168826 [Botryobasidium botryosum FD-172 SS1]